MFFIHLKTEEEELRKPLPLKYSQNALFLDFQFPFLGGGSFSCSLTDASVLDVEVCAYIEEVSSTEQSGIVPLS